MQTVDFQDLTREWIDSKKCDNDLKILKIEKCSNLRAVSSLLYRVDVSDMKSLFVLVLEIQSQFEDPNLIQIEEFRHIFKDYRPVLLQINAPRGKKFIFLKNYMVFNFRDFSISYPIINAFREMLDNHVCFGDDILTAKMSRIPETWESVQNVAGAVQCLRFINLFIGGCDRILPPIAADWILEQSLIHLEALFAYIDYPFVRTSAADHAWQSKRYDLVEMFITRDCPFPNEFDINQILPRATVGLETIVNQRRNLHRSIADQNIEEVSRILDEIQEVPRLKRAYNEANDSAMATVLRNFNVDIYALLLRKKMKFCGKCRQLLMDLPYKTRQIIADKNKEFFIPCEVKTDDHPIISKCWLPSGHFRTTFYFDFVRLFFRHLELVPESKQLLRLATKCPGLKLVFDFKYENTGMVDPRYNRVAVGTCYSSGLIYISAYRRTMKPYGTITHELAHLAMLMLYGNDYEPFRLEDVGRKQEYEEIVAECKAIEAKKETLEVDAISIAFRDYESNKIASELIVRVPQIYASFNTPKKEAAESKYAKLFAFYFKYIVPDIDLFLNKLELSDEQKSSEQND